MRVMATSDNETVEVKEVGSGFTASQNNKIGKIVDNFYIQLNAS
jgi:hypothetical protein